MDSRKHCILKKSYLNQDNRQQHKHGGGTIENNTTHGLNQLLTKRDLDRSRGGGSGVTQRVEPILPIQSRGY